MQVAHTAHAQVVEEAMTKGAICVELSLKALHVDQEVDDVAVCEAVAECLGGCGRQTVQMSKTVGISTVGTVVQHHANI